MRVLVVCGLLPLVPLVVAILWRGTEAFSEMFAGARSVGLVVASVLPVGIGTWLLAYAVPGMAWSLLWLGVGVQAKPPRGAGCRPAGVQAGRSGDGARSRRLDTFGDGAVGVDVGSPPHSISSPPTRVGHLDARR